MTPDEWIIHYRQMKPTVIVLTQYHVSRILNNLEAMIKIVNPSDADEIRKHVVETIRQSPHTNYCGD